MQYKTKPPEYLIGADEHSMVVLSRKENNFVEVEIDHGVGRPTAITISREKLINALHRT